MKNFNIAAIAAFSLLLLSCGGRASFECTVEGLTAGDTLVVKTLDGVSLQTLDTLKADASGKVCARVEVVNEPRFVYVFRGERRIASMLLEDGEKAVVTADTLGNYSVEGSSESEKLASMDREYNDFLLSLTGADSKTLAEKYLAYYRKCSSFVVENSTSLAAVPVLYRKIGDFPVFSSVTDALLFRRVLDSLSIRYPESGLLAPLEKETLRREKTLNMNDIVRGAETVGFLDINLPSMNGEKVALSSVEASDVIVYFWDSSKAADRSFNLNTLLPLYKSSKDLEIYAVCVDAYKPQWADIVKSQKLPWINVNDGLGAASPVLSLYNISSTPCCMVIRDGNIVAGGISGESELKKALE